ncbi:type II secretion system minor pseudopilin GspK [Pseudomonas syringae]|nr:type II secretion system minor pseudopilin GspK [Pseudomonas syringae]MBD8792865.1 type II secretion system minor pseudopilin GspK [Pseudomonas syringae]MBD8803514.1 type II secretion system minor pseudopilin GspK [Pseudomonas syringae]MBD8814153.1 type II secretion system minor pseudopilin GspK [Pseudomonas syringae]
MRRQQQGAALLMVLVALAMLAGGLTWLVAQGRQQVDGVRLVQQRIQARAVEKAALAFTEQALKDPLWRASPMFWQALRGQPLSYDFAGGKSSIRIVDLHTCFNVNSLIGPQADRARNQLLHLLGDDMAAERLADSLIDWLDANHQARLHGAENPEYSRQSPARLAGNQPMADISEMNLLAVPGARAAGSLCVLPDSEGWQLNANALNLEHLPLLEALYEGEIPRAQLTRLLTGRPPGGYKDASDLRSAMGAMDDEAFARLSEGLLLNGDHFLLQIETTLDGQAFRSQYRVQARGVVKWHSRVPAQQMVVRGREI